MENFLGEGAVLKQGLLPQDAAAGVTAARIGLDVSARIAIVVNMGDSIAAGAVTFKIEQHDAASAGNTKDLDIDNRYYKKVAAATTFTKVVPSVADADYDLTVDFSGDEGLVVFEVLGEDLDVNNGFSHISITLAATTAAKIVGVLYVGHKPFKKSAHEVAA